jgi:hypothetical protein
MGDLLARLLSGSGAWAYTLSRLGRYRLSPMGSPLSVVGLLAASFLLVLGLYQLGYATIGLGEAAPTPATIEDACNRNVAGGAQWITLTGTIDATSLDVHSRNDPSRVYLLTDPTGHRGFLVPSRMTLYPGHLEITGVVKYKGGLFVVSDPNTIDRWSAWARSTFPSVEVCDRAYLDAGDEPASATGLWLGAGMVGLSAWLFAGCLLGLRTWYVVFRHSTANVPPPDWSAPRPACIRASGRFSRARLGLLADPAVREAPAMIRTDDKDSATCIIESDAFEAVFLRPGLLEDAVPVRVLPFLGSRPGIRLRADRLALVLSFDDDTTRDLWLAKLSGMIIRPNTLPGAVGSR